MVSISSINNSLSYIFNASITKSAYELSTVFLSSRISQFQLSNHHSQIDILTLFLIAVWINYRRCRRWFPRGFRRPIEGSWDFNRRIFRWDLSKEKKLLFGICQRRIVISMLKRAINIRNSYNLLIVYWL